MQDKIDRLRQQAVPPQSLFINGRWQPAADGNVMAVISPIDGTQLTTIAAATAIDVDRAAAAARDSFEKGTWAKAAPVERRKVLLKIAELIERNALELAVLGVRDNGTEISMALKAEPGSAANSFRYYAEAIDKVYGEIAPTAENILGLVHRAPVGVVGAIVPWNFPMMIGAWKIAPALAAGNSIVLKPAEGASLSLLRLAELCAEAGLPEGVLNVVTAPGPLPARRWGCIPISTFWPSPAPVSWAANCSNIPPARTSSVSIWNLAANHPTSSSRCARSGAGGKSFGLWHIPQFRPGLRCGSRLLVERSIAGEVAEKVSAMPPRSRLATAGPYNRSRRHLQ
ncbi:aldehyde dehydrogenase [Brucella melitensis bv. 1 str. 16M]|uniref:Aldehyde dehydrogenase n=1 Tax=Brucella melitensis biotype 1 (strain ATCC 23456 / CCUG 17765 / NCTC 10094 / 16M) TaxID=224914 RepID=Q8YDQ0_BRUME|nr:aldehyde dehydrogenase [Brucella melitensis bv. 1 str. 16M]